MRSSEIFQRFIERTNSLSQLARSQKTSRREIGVPQALGEFGKNHVAGRILRIEHRHALVACEGLDATLLLQEKFGGSAELFQRLGKTILLLKQRCVTHQTVGRLGEGAKKASKNRRGLGMVARLEQAVELDAVVLSGEGRFIQTSVDVGERLQGLLMAGHFVESRLVFGDSFAKFVLLEVFPSAFEKFIDLWGHRGDVVRSAERAEQIGWDQVCSRFFGAKEPRYSIYTGRVGAP